MKTIKIIFSKYCLLPAFYINVFILCVFRPFHADLVYCVGDEYLRTRSMRPTYLNMENSTSDYYGDNYDKYAANPDDMVGILRSSCIDIM